MKYVLHGHKFDKFTMSYLDALLWSETDDNDEPLDSNYDVFSLAPETVADAVADCAVFQEAAGEMIANREGRAGHDFLLTRNGHGAGFWDGDWTEHGDTLTALSRTFGEVNAYVGDDGMLYAMPWRDTPTAEMMSRALAQS